MTSVSLLCPGAPARSAAGFSRPAVRRRLPRPARSPAAEGSPGQGKRAEGAGGRGGKSARLCSGWSGLLLCQQWSIISRMTPGQRRQTSVGTRREPSGGSWEPRGLSSASSCPVQRRGRSCSPLGAIPRVREQGSALPGAGQEGALLRPDAGSKGPGLHTPLKPAGDGAGFLPPPEPHSSLAGLHSGPPFPRFWLMVGAGEGGCVSSAQPPERQVQPRMK